ncbi:MAG: hypothetical protein ACN4GR_17300 [Arenicellales bacterium]
MEEKSSDFMVDLVNSERALGAEDFLLIAAVVVVIAVAITWWFRKR